MIIKILISVLTDFLIIVGASLIVYGLYVIFPPMGYAAAGFILLTGGLFIASLEQDDADTGGE